MSTQENRTNLPIGFNFSGLRRTKPSRIGYKAGKKYTQAQFVPKLQRPLSNGGKDANNGLMNDEYGYDWGNPLPYWYPSARPLKQYRLNGTSNAIGTYTNSSKVMTNSGEDICYHCPRSSITIGAPFKMIGKNHNGMNKELKYDSNGCLLCNPTSGALINQIGVAPKHEKGSIISFSGAAKLNSAVTTLNKNYYQSYASFRHARGKDYKSNLIVHQIPGIQYNKPIYSIDNTTPIGSEIIWPDKQQQITEPENSQFKGAILNSSYYRGNSCINECINQTGINLSCAICQNIEGYHTHPNNSIKYPNDANQSEMCPICVIDEGKIHTHSCTNNITNSENCSLSIYKPSNSQFAVQGAVDSSSRITRLKYNTITKNNASFYNNGNPTQWGGNAPSTRMNIVPNLMYQSNPIFFIKNKVNRGKAFHKNGNRTVCGGYGATPCAGSSKMAFTLPLAIGGR